MVINGVGSWIREQVGEDMGWARTLAYILRTFDVAQRPGAYNISIRLAVNNENKEAHVAAPASLGHRRHRFVHRRVRHLYSVRQQKSRLENSCCN
jgi:hypothetical protein